MGKKGKQIKRLLVCILVAIMVFGGVAYAASQFLKTMTAQFVIVPSGGEAPPTAADLKIYSDVGMTQEITGVDFGSLTASQSKTITVYLKNNSQTTFTGVVVSSGLDNSKGTITGNVGSIAPGGNVGLPITLATKPAATSTSGIIVTLTVGY